MTPIGKGFWIWQILLCEKGDPREIARVAAEAGLSHLFIKIADGCRPYNYGGVRDLVPPVVSALREAIPAIELWGWHYVYGSNPEGEGRMAVRRMRELDLDGYIIDAEGEYKKGSNRYTNAALFMKTLKNGLQEKPIALASYRFPSQHRSLPWETFLEGCDYNMPQVYWLQAHNAGDQLYQCIEEFRKIQPRRPILPAGAAFTEHNWAPKASDVIEFMGVAKALGLPSVSFWEWGNTRKNLPEVWEAIASYRWGNEPQKPPIDPPPAPDRYQMRVVQDALRLRAAPSTSATVRGTLPQGELVDVDDIAGQDAWVRTPAAPEHPAGWANVQSGDDRNMEVVE